MTKREELNLPRQRILAVERTEVTQSAGGPVPRYTERACFFFLTLIILGGLSHATDDSVKSARVLTIQGDSYHHILCVQAVVTHFVL